MSKIKPKSKKSNKPEIEKAVMEKVESNQIKMKPKWLFVAGSVSAILGFIAFSLVAVFFTNLTIFLIQKKGPGYGRLTMLLQSFPLWIPILAIFGIVLGVLLLKKYDFSYKKNFLLIMLVFIASIIIAGLLIDQLGLNNVWSQRGPMKGFYQQLNRREQTILQGNGKMRGKNY